MTPKDNFEERLLSELRQVAADRPAPDAAPERPLRSRRPARFALAGGGLAAMVAAVAIIASSGGNTTSAYAVDTNPDGAVTVNIKSLKDATGLENSLREAGIPAVVDYSPAMPLECAVPAVRAKPVPTDASAGVATPQSNPKFLPTKTPGVASVRATKADGRTFTVDPQKIQEGQTLYVTKSVRPVKTIDGAKAESVALTIGSEPEVLDC